MADRVEIVPYNPDWPEEFAVIAGRLRAALGDLAVRIDHIGSTSVPGLAAKDVIDVQITVPTAAAMGGVYPLVSSMGYVLREGIVDDHVPPGWTGDPAQWLKAYLKHPETMRPTNTHIRVAGNANQRYALLFRDYLRAHPKMAAAYAEAKRRLAGISETRDAYVETKDPICDLIAFPAEDWAEATGWTPGPSDA